MTHDISKKAIAVHKKLGGKIEVTPKAQIKDKGALSIFYTPGVGAVSSLLGKHPLWAREYTIKRNSVAVVSDGSAVLGLGNIGPYGALPVMEGKAMLFKSFAGSPNTAKIFYLRVELPSVVDHLVAGLI